MINMQNVHVSTKYRCHYEMMILGKYKWNTEKKKTTTHENKFNEWKELPQLQRICF